jgi:hypothetical protein
MEREVERNGEAALNVDTSVSCSVPSYRIEGSNVFYRITISSGEQDGQGEYRFSSLLQFHDAVRSEYKGEQLLVMAECPGCDFCWDSLYLGDKRHLLENFPVFPPKQNLFTIDHHGTQFLYQRRCALDTYFKKLLALPGMLDHPRLMRLLNCGRSEEEKRCTLDSEIPSHHMEESNGKYFYKVRLPLLTGPVGSTRCATVRS